MAKKEGGTATVESAEISTSDRIVDAAVLRLRAGRIEGNLRVLLKRMRKVAGKLEEHEQSAASAKLVRQQTMLFEDMGEAMLTAELELIGALETALQAAIEASEGYDPDGD